MDEFLLIKSKTLRNKLCTENAAVILDRVGQLVYLPQSGYATTENVALFYQVPVDTVKKVVRRHRDEIETDGYKILSANEFREGFDVPLKSKTRQVAIFSRRAILRIGMLLTNSEVAKAVRSYLLQREESGISPTTGGNLAQMAEVLQQHAIQIGEHSDQLIGQAGLIKAMVGTINWHGQNIQNLEKNCNVFENRICKLERNREIEAEKKEDEYITTGQIDILREKVKKRGRPITIWKQFNKYFGLSRYRFLPAGQFKEAVEWLDRGGK